MSLKKLIKTLAKTVDMRQEMRDMDDRPIQCQCCVIRMTNADGTSSEFWYHAFNNGAAGYSCAFTAFGVGPQPRPCNECGTLH